MLPAAAPDAPGAARAAKGSSCERGAAVVCLLLLACTARNPAFVDPVVTPPAEPDAAEQPRPKLPRDAGPPDLGADPDASPEASVPDAAEPDTAAIIDAAPDLRPDLPVERPPPGAALLVVGDTTLSKSDAQLKAGLEALRFTVTARTGSASAAGDATGKALVVISGSAISADVNSKFRDVPIPVVVFDASVFGPMKMTGTKEDTDFGTALGDKRVAIVQPAHPLAAGLSGTITVANDNIQVSWGVPSSSAIKVATIAGQANHFTLFAYAAGSTMVGPVAPARRVGAFVRYPESTTYTSDGLLLFRAIVTWAANL
jgi:hypothetical protein